MDFKVIDVEFCIQIDFTEEVELGKMATYCLGNKIVGKIFNWMTS